MEEWKSYKMGDLFTLEYGKPVEDKDSIDGPIPVFGTNGQIGTSHLAPLCNHPSVILGRKGAYRGVHFSDRPFSVIDTAFYVEPISDVFDIKWLYYKLLTYDINSMDSGSAIPSTDRYQIYSLSIDLPSLEVQKRTVRVLDSINDKIALNNRINHNLEKQAQALYKSWFVDFEPFKDRKFVESELGMIPEGWRVGTLSELGDIVAGGTPSKAKPEYYSNNGIAWLTPKDLSVKCNKFTAKGELDITEDGYKNSSAKLMPRGTVLFSSRAPIGYISIAKGDICTNQGFKSIVPKYAGTAYLYYWLQENTNAIEAQASGSTFKEASGSLMKSFPALIPCKDVLDAFEDDIMPILKEQENLEEENGHTEQLRDILLPHLMSGEWLFNDLTR